MESTEQMVRPSVEIKLKVIDRSQEISSVTEGKQNIEQTTMMAQNHIRSDFIGLRTVPVILKNGDGSLTLNALLDDATTKTYINADVAAELGLKGKTEQVTVNVLNNLVETFETRPVNVELKSANGKLRVKVPVYTAKRVTGSMTVVD